MQKGFGMKQKKIRYAVVGLGHISQTAILPAFKNASKNSELTALVSSDPKKLKVLSKKYKVPHCFRYTDYEEMLKGKIVDAVYIATPNTIHRQFVDPAIKNGIHVICEKPLTNNVADCLAMQKLISEYGTKFMTAYRLHFDAANLEAIKIAKQGELGNLRIFSSLFTMQVKDRGNIRLLKEMGGGPYWDIGIYCINAARYLFKAEPYEVYAAKLSGNDSRFKEVDEMFSAILKFPDAKLASFTCSFGASSTATYDLVGTKGSLRLENAYEYSSSMELHVKKNEKTSTKKFKKHDQFAAELLYFSDCVLKNKTPEPGIKEGLIDVEIIEALLRSAETGNSTVLRIDKKDDRPTPDQLITRPGIKEPATVNLTNPSGNN